MYTLPSKLINLNNKNIMVSCHIQPFQNGKAIFNLKLWCIALPCLGLGVLKLIKNIFKYI